MTEKRDNPLEHILDELLTEPDHAERTPVQDAALAGADGPTTPHPDRTGETSRSHRFLADDAVIRDILQDMAKLSHDDLDELDSSRHGHGEYKALDQVARETGLISFEQQEAVFRSYLEHRVDELKEKLVGAQIGSYSIIDELGRGGMGIVFKARQESPMFTREVALKFMLAGPESETHDRERFISEVKGLAGLSHPFLVPIFDSGIEGDLYYFSMEFIDGLPLSDSAVTDELSVEKKVEIVRDIARALGYLHGQSVIHRDVKPGNIMLDRHGNARLLDFGIAQFSADPRRRVAQAGTPFYMAPEVIDPGGSFGPIGPGTDIYALGAVLYKLLTGHEVFPGEDDLTEVFRKTLKDEPSFSTTRRRIVHPDLERIMRRCLRKRVDDRYASAAGLANDLDRFLKRTRFRLWHFAAAAVALVLVTFAVAVSLPDPPAPEPSEDMAAISRAGERVDKLEILWNGKLQTVGLSAEEKQALETALGELATEVNGAGTSEGQRRFQGRLDRFYLDASGYLESRVDAAKESAAAEPVLQMKKNSSWNDANTFDRDARSSTDRYRALELYILAIEAFRAARDEAEREGKREQERWEAEKARNRAGDARERVDLELLSLSPSAQARYEEGRKLEERAEDDWQKGESTSAKTGYGNAEVAFEDASEKAREAHARFTQKRRELGDDLESFLSGFELHLKSYIDNIPEQALKEKIQQIADRRESVLDDLGKAKDSARLAVLREDLDQWIEWDREASERFDFVKGAALKIQERVESLLDQGFLKRLPKVCAKDTVEIRKVLVRLREKLDAGAYLEAANAYGRLKHHLGELKTRHDELTEGMIWIDEGTVAGRPVAGFWIDLREVTVNGYAAYLRGFPDAEPPLDWPDQKRFHERPVVGVSYAQAQAFASRRGKSLPSYDQWRLAVRGESAPESFRRSLSPDLDAPGARIGEVWRNPAEWVRPSREGDQPALVFNEANMQKEGSVLLSEIRTLAGFRCIREALRWEDR